MKSFFNRIRFILYFDKNIRFRMESNEIRRGVCACSNSRMHTFSRDISVFCETVCLYHVQTRQRNVYPSNVSRDVDMQHDLCKHVSSKIHSKGSRPSKAVSSFTSLRFRTLEETLRDKDSCSIRNLNSTIRNEKRFFPPPFFFSFFDCICLFSSPFSSSSSSLRSKRKLERHNF